eukprot:90494_1
MNLSNKRFTTKYSELTERPQKRVINSNNLYERYEMCMKHHITPVLAQNFANHNTAKHCLNHICSCQSTKQHLKHAYQKEYRVSIQHALYNDTELEFNANHGTTIHFDVNNESFSFKLMMLSSEQIQTHYPSNSITHSVCSIAGTYTSIIWELNTNYCMEIRLMHKCQKPIKLKQQSAANIDKFWYESVWGVYGFDGANMFIGIHNNPFVGDWKDNVQRVLMVLHQKNGSRNCKKAECEPTEFKINGHWIPKIINNTGKMSSLEEIDRRCLEINEEYSVPPLVEVDTKKRKRQRDMTALQALNISLVAITRELYDKVQRMKTINQDLTNKLNDERIKREIEAQHRNESMKNKINALEQMVGEEQEKTSELQRNRETVDALLDEQHRVIEELSKSEEFWRNKRFEEICEEHDLSEKLWDNEMDMPPRKRRRIMDEECNGNSVFCCMEFNDDCLYGFSSESDEKCVDFNMI